MPRGSSPLRILTAFLVILSPLAAGCTREPPAASEAELASGDTVHVVKVVKGDEVVVEKGERSTRVRLLGIYAFDDPSSEGVEQEPSIAFLDATLVDRDIAVTFDQPIKDVHGRYLAYATLAERDVNQSMVEQGAVIVYTEFPFARETAYLRSEEVARREQRGVWARAGTVELITGLRRQWTDYRARQFGSPAPDPLLAAAAQEPSAQQSAIAQPATHE